MTTIKPHTTSQNIGIVLISTALLIAAYCPVVEITTGQYAAISRAVDISTIPMFKIQPAQEYSTRVQLEAVAEIKLNATNRPPIKIIKRAAAPQ